MILPFISTAVQSACILRMISMMYFGKWSRFGRLDTAAEWERASFTAGCGSIGQLQRRHSWTPLFFGPIMQKDAIAPAYCYVLGTTAFVFRDGLFLPPLYVAHLLSIIILHWLGRHFSNWIYLLFCSVAEATRKREKESFFLLYLSFFSFLFYLFRGKKRRG